MGQPDPSVTVCGNCAEPLRGRFCHACGQKAVSAEVRLKDFFHDAFHEFAHLDGKIVRTLRLLITKPGMLTAEFLAGRRASYVSPLRLYLTCSVVFFALVAFTPDSRLSFFTVRYTPSPGEAPLDPATLARYQQEASLRAGRAVVQGFPRVMFALMPAYGLLTWAFYRKTRPFYAAHLYYSIHFHAFAFLALTLEVAVILAAGQHAPRWLNWLAPTMILVYHYVGLRRVFGGSHRATAWKAALLWVGYVALIFASLIGVAFASGAITRSAPPAVERDTPGARP